MGINVLSLFDGMSCGLQALKNIGIEVDNYYASEIDRYAQIVSRNNHPEIIRLGDITMWESWGLPKIDLLIGGSPCQGFSLAGKRLNINDPRSALIFEFIDILVAYEPANFLLENVVMKKEYQDTISCMVGVDPVMINSELLSAQSRKRLYWSNSKITMPDKIDIFISDISINNIDITERCMCKIPGTLAEERILARTKYLCEKLNCLTAVGQCISNSGATNIFHNDKMYKPSVETCELAQGLFIGYTEGVSNTQRYKMLGNGWTLPVIEHIFSGMDL